MQRLIAKRNLKGVMRKQIVRATSNKRQERKNLGSRENSRMRSTILTTANAYKPSNPERRLARMTGYGESTMHSRSKAQLLSEHLSGANVNDLVSE